MSVKFNEYKDFNLSKINVDILKYWKDINAFEKSITTRADGPNYVFYEGPPSANGVPGIHHVMARAIKDIFCRYKTLKGFKVDRKAGWDTHGLPIELSVEKALGITKVDIGTKITIEDYNKECRKDVMKYTDLWVDLTEKMGYWVDMDNPYITYENKYIETLWYLLKELYKKGLLYKGYTIQPYSPAAGTGLSSHELNLPGCYRMVKDTTCVAQFKLKQDNHKLVPKLFGEQHGKETLTKGCNPLLFTDVFILAWTTTPWTLLSNTALAVGKNIVYVQVQSFNQYTGEPITVILAKELLGNYFPAKDSELQLSDYVKGNKNIPYKVIGEYTGLELEGLRYEQLLPYQQPTDGDAFRVVIGDFVTTSDGTGIVHLAPSFGADDFRVCKQNGIGSLTLVDKQGKFVEGTGEFSGRYVKNSYDNIPDDVNTVDIDIAIKLKTENRAFKVEKYEHSYPHCWRTDKPILYYPLDSWFIKTTALKDRMVELNNTINWKPQSTGTGRFGQWLENLVDWNLSRSRYWGTPLPIWISEDKDEFKCIGSVEELKAEVAKAVDAGYMKSNPFDKFVVSDNTKANYEKFDLHRPYVDDIVLVSSTGGKMTREPDLIDVWFDSGAMPYAQLHYPFEHKDDFADYFPADFIAEGVDQTRGWFYTLHAIATMLFDSVSFKNIISNGLVLDKNGNKMSKRLGNGVDPFTTIEKYGSDPTRWYMIANAQPWDNLKFDVEGIEEVRRKFYGTLYNTYSFFALYSNIDNFNYSEAEVPIAERTELDRWIISLLNTLIKEVDDHYKSYEPTKAARAIQNFVGDNLSNWYVRLNRKRFWGGEYSKDKIAAYQTLYTCIETVAILASPISPFYMEKIFLDLNKTTNRDKSESVHLTTFPVYNESYINKELEYRMDMAQKISSMVLSLRRKVNIKVRQPLSKIIIPVLDIESTDSKQILSVKDIILSEINVKDIEFINANDANSIIVKRIKANFKSLGPKYNKLMKEISAAINNFNQDDINLFEKQAYFDITLNGQNIKLELPDVEITFEDIPGWIVANEGSLTVALDINITEQLREEGIAREFINRIQNLRKDSGFEVTDKIDISIQKHELINNAIYNFESYIKTQTLANSIKLFDMLENNNSLVVEIDTNISTLLRINK